MKLRVHFETDDSCVVKVLSHEIGLDDLDMIREETGVKNLALDRVYYRAESVYIDPIIRISEMVARSSGHFHDTPTIRVKCNPQQLNDFVVRRVVATRDDETGEVESAKIVCEVDEEAIIDAWTQADYPLDWRGDEAEE